MCLMIEQITHHSISVGFVILLMVLYKTSGCYAYYDNTRFYLFISLSNKHSIWVGLLLVFISLHSMPYDGWELAWTCWCGSRWRLTRITQLYYHIYPVRCRYLPNKITIFPQWDYNINSMRLLCFSFKCCRTSVVWHWPNHLLFEGTPLPHNHVGVYQPPMTLQFVHSIFHISGVSPSRDSLLPFFSAYKT